MKKILFFILFISFWISSVFSATWNLKDQVQECVNTVNKRAIEDFLCVGWWEQFVAYQILLDKRFKEIDTEIEVYIWELEKNKSFYFWIDKSETYLDAVQQIINKYGPTWDFWKKYALVCSWLANEVIAEFGTLENSNAAIMLVNPGVNSKNPCEQLADQKLAIYKQVSYDVLLLNKLQISQDEKKLYVQEQRSKYDSLLSKFSINLGYVERIWAKWPSKIRNTSGNG